jgi:pimeloyl-ACP methyl ester carboxylesterase
MTTTSLVQVNDVRLNVAQAGEENQDCIIFLHGFPESHLSWTPYLTAFSATHHVVAPDNRGFGDSDKPANVGDYDIQKMVADVCALIAHFSSTPITLVGHDWGGIVAWHVAALYPELLKRLVILNAPHPTIFRQTLINDEAQRAASQYINRLRDSGCEARIQAMGCETFWMSLFGAHLASGAISPAHKAKQVAAWGAPGALTAMLNWYRASSYFVPTDVEKLTNDVAPLANISVPTMVIWGMKDPMLLPCQLTGLSDYASSLTVRTLAEGGHGLIHESPEEIIGFMRAFMATA